MASSKKPAAPAAAAAVVRPAGGKFARLKSVTLPVLKLADETPVYVKVTGVMFEGKEQKPVIDAKTGKPAAAMEPATLLPVINLETGEVAQIIAGAVLEGILTDEYKDGAYVGKGFEIVKHAKREGKRYNTYSVFEIDPDAVNA